MTPDEFRGLCIALWGRDHWKPCAAVAFDVTARTVEFWAASAPARSKPVPADVAASLWNIVTARAARHEWAGQENARQITPPGASS